MKRYFFACLLFIAACGPVAKPTSSPDPQVISVYASPATQPWLSETLHCAQELQMILYTSNDPAQADISIRLGEPAGLNSLAYQIGSDDILIVTHRESPLQNLTREQAQALFSNPEKNMQVWVFAPAEDIQQVFTLEIMQGSATTSLAQLALSPQQMSDSMNAEKNAVGILPRRWKTETLRDVFTLANVPVLALTQSEPQGAIQALLGCMQKSLQN